MLKRISRTSFGGFLWFDDGVAGVDVGVGEQAAEVLVAAVGLDQQGQVAVVREGDLGAGDRGDAGGASGLSELHRPVQAVVVGDGQGLIAEFGRAT